MEYAKGGDLFNFIMDNGPYTEDGPYNPKEVTLALILTLTQP